MLYREQVVPPEIRFIHVQRVLTPTRASGARRYRSPDRPGGVALDVRISQLEEEYRQCSPHDLPLTPKCRFQGPRVLRHVFNSAANVNPQLILGSSPGYDVEGWWPGLSSVETA